MSVQAPPLTAAIGRDDDGLPYLKGSRCNACQRLIVGKRSVCPACAARDRMTPVQLSERGKVYAWTIVNRSFPGVRTPFIDVIVDLDDGAHLKGTLEGIPCEPSAIRFDLPVRLIWREVGLRGSDQTWLTYAFVPAEQDQIERMGGVHE